jgi:hypothetical protein
MVLLSASAEGLEQHFTVSWPLLRFLQLWFRNHPVKNLTKYTVFVL